MLCMSIRRSAHPSVRSRTLPSIWSSVFPSYCYWAQWYPHTIMLCTIASCTLMLCTIALCRIILCTLTGKAFKYGPNKLAARAYCAQRDYAQHYCAQRDCAQFHCAQSKCFACQSVGPLIRPFSHALFRLSDRPSFHLIATGDNGIRTQ